MSAIKVQSTTAVGSNATSQTIALTGVTAGNCLILLSTYLDTSQGSSAVPTKSTDSNGTVSVAIAPAAQWVVGNFAQGAMIEFVPNCASGTHTFTVNPFNHAGQMFCELFLAEWSGLTATPLDKTSSGGSSAAASATTGNTGSSGVLMQAAELVLGLIGLGATTGLTNANISHPPAGYTDLWNVQNTSTNVGTDGCYIEPNSTAAITTTWTFTADTTLLTWQAVEATFLESGGAAATINQVDFDSRRNRPGRGPYSTGAYFRPSMDAFIQKNVTVSLTGQAITSATGTLAPDSSVALTGKSITSAQGTLIPAFSLALTGQKITSAVGTLSPAFSVPLVGQSATFSTGTLTASSGGDITVALTGQAATFTAGSLSPSIDTALTGQAGTFAQGTLVANPQLALSGNVITSASGTFSAAIDTDLLGNSAVFTTGNLTVPGDVTVALIGISATFTAGTLVAVLPEVEVEAPSGSVPGFVRGKKKKKDGPYMREGQVFGEEYPVSPFLGEKIPPKLSKSPKVSKAKQKQLVVSPVSDHDLIAIHALFAMMSADD